MWSEFIASFFYSATFLPSAIGELWRSGDFLFESSWIPIIFGRAGFTFLDENLLHALSPRNVVVLQYNKEILDRLLRNPFVDDNTFVIMKRFLWSQSRSDVVATVSGSYYRSPMPDFRRHYGDSNKTFAVIHFAFDKQTFQRTLQLRNAPKYLKAMLDNAYSVRAGTRDVIVVSRTDLDNQAIKSRIGRFVKNVMSSNKIAENADGPMILLSGYSNVDPKPSHLSEIWERSFDGNVIPYGLPARKKILKSNAPIAAFNKWNDC
jgi:hypothetical protein